MRAKRAIALFFVLILFFALLIMKLVSLTNPGNSISQAAQIHGGYNLKVATLRGTIYDTKMRAIVNSQSQYFAAVAPQNNAGVQFSALSRYVSDIDTLKKDLAERLPFLIRVSTPQISAKGITVVKTDKRYSNDALAPQLIGYVNDAGSGVTGIEKAFDKELKAYSQTVGAYFPTDAQGRSLEGLTADITVDGGGHTGGVQLTIDNDIQNAAQNAAHKYLKTGAVVVMDPQSGDILACVSVPDYTQNDLSTAVKGSNSPMLNRAFSSYNVGSVFKICVAAAALESNISSGYSVDCAGSVNVAGRTFSDENKKGHGQMDMASGMANSCNVYYITLGQSLGGDKLLAMARTLGFGRSAELASGITPDSGTLPTLEKLRIPAALANFSIGEGDLMATPVQIARMVSAVANNGLMPSPRIVKAIVDNNLKTVKSYSTGTSDRVFSENTASLLRQFLIKTVNEGTGMPASPRYGGAGGKTATAETGWTKNGTAMNQAWFAGFYPASSPKYVIAVLAENGSAGGTDAGPVFQYIANSLAPKCGYPFVMQ